MTRAEWTTALRYGHLQSAPVMVDVGYTRGVGTACIPCILVGLHSPVTLDSSMASFPLPTRTSVKGGQSEVNEVLEFLTVIASAKTKKLRG